jgi:hypothetical protein
MLRTVSMHNYMLRAYPCVSPSRGEINGEREKTDAEGVIDIVVSSGVDKLRKHKSEF